MSPPPGKLHLAPLKRALCLFSRSTVAVLKFIMIFGKGLPCFYHFIFTTLFALGPTSYVAILL